MDKDKYIERLKDINLRPNKLKIKPRSEVILNEKEKEKQKMKEIIKEIFVQSAEIESIPSGPTRDMQILRLSIIAEYDATNLYEKFAGLTSNENIKKVLLDIANEEKAHIGEFEFLLEHIDPDHEKNENEGEDEAKNLTGLDEPPGEED